VRIALIADSHGSLPALEAVLAASKAVSPDLIVHAGDVITVPFSPDPPDESIALLRAEGIPTVIGNHELFFRGWQAPEWETMLQLRAARWSRPLGPWVDHAMARGQAQIDADNLAWLRELPYERSFDGVYLTHSLPGNPFLSIDGGDRREEGVTEEVRGVAFASPGPAAAELMLCGHAHAPRVLRRPRPERDDLLIVRAGAACGMENIHYPPTEWRAHYAIVTRTPAGWEHTLASVDFAPTDPGWDWWRSIGVPRPR
jgi:predicted phosphodiesterase